MREGGVGERKPLVFLIATFDKNVILSLLFLLACLLPPATANIEVKSQTSEEWKLRFKPIVYRNLATLPQALNWCFNFNVKTCNTRFALRNEQFQRVVTYRIITVEFQVPRI